MVKIINALGVIIKVMVAIIFLVAVTKIIEREEIRASWPDRVCRAQHTEDDRAACKQIISEIKKSGQISMAGIPNLSFYCVCGRYEDCKDIAEQKAHEKGYRIQSHDFKFREDKDEQSIILFRATGMSEIVVLYDCFYLIGDFGSYCA